MTPFGSAQDRPAPSIALVAISRRGAELAYRLLDSLDGEVTLHVEKRFLKESRLSLEAFDLPLRPRMGKLFSSYDGLVLFMPVGAAVRLLAPHMKNKQSDPAVVCVDDGGQFAVSLISGHTGGADALAQQVADAIGATPVITSASHSLDTLAADMLGKELNWQLDADPQTVTRVSAAIVNGEPVAILQESGEPDWWSNDKPLPENITIYDSLEALGEASPSAALIITDRLVDKSIVKNSPTVFYRPKSLVVGMGCRRGVPEHELSRFLLDTLIAKGLSIRSVKCIATTEAKCDEEGITMLANKLDVPVRYYDDDALNSRPGPSGPSAAQEHLGVVGVSEPAALLASENDKLLLPKVKSANATIAVARVNFSL